MGVSEETLGAGHGPLNTHKTDTDPHKHMQTEKDVCKKEPKSLQTINSAPAADTKPRVNHADAEETEADGCKSKRHA